MPPRLVYATATLWMKMAATAVALLALAATSSSARGVSALRSSVDRDFLRAHFEAHLLQRDWLPQPSSFSSLSQHAAEVAQQHAASGGGVADASAVSATAANAAAYLLPLLRPRRPCPSPTLRPTTTTTHRQRRTKSSSSRPSSGTTRRRSRSPPGRSTPQTLLRSRTARTSPRPPGRSGSWRTRSITC